MKIETYIKKTGRIFGISSKHQFGWQHKVHVFTDAAKAEEWLCAEEYDFRERELCSFTRAAEIAGRKAVEAAEEDELHNDRTAHY